MNLNHLRVPCTYFDGKMLTERMSELYEAKTRMEAVCNTFQGDLSIAAPHMKSQLPIFVLRHNGVLKHYINPVITLHKNRQNEDKTEIRTAIESHWTLSGITAEVTRKNKVELEYLHFNHENKLKYGKRTVNGKESILIQQMFDQINGIVFLDRANKKEIIRPIAKQGEVVRINLAKEEGKFEYNYFVEGENELFFGDGQMRLGVCPDTKDCEGKLWWEGEFDIVGERKEKDKIPDVEWKDDKYVVKEEIADVAQERLSGTAGVDNYP